MNKKKSLGVNAVLNGIRTFLNLLFPLITFPYVSKVLGVVNVGKYNFAVSVNQYFMLIAALGISTYAIREGAKYRDDKYIFSNFASKIFSINMAATILSYVLLIFCIITVPKLHDYSIILLVLSIEIFFTTLGTEWIYSIYEEYTYITIRSIIFKVISIVLLLVLVKKKEDYIIYAGITVFANAGSNILNYLRAKKICNIKLTVNCNWKEHIRPILILFASLAATSIYVNSDTTMLGFMRSDYEVGIYSVSAKIYRIVKQMLSSVLIVSIPRLAWLMGKNRIDEYRKTLTQIFSVLIMLVFPAVVGLFMMSKEIVILISSSDYIQATSSLKLLSIALIFCIFGWVYNQCVLIPAKKEKIVLVATIISAITNVVINLFLVPVWAENAVAFSTIIAEAIMMAICVFYGHKVVRLEKGVVLDTVSVCIGCVVIIITCTLVRKLQVSTVATLFTSMVCSVITYVTALYILKNKVIAAALETLKKHFCK